MSLVLSLRVGHDFYVQDKRVVVSWIDSPFRFGLRREDGVGVTVTDDVWTDLFQGVRVQAGIPRNLYAKVVRLVINAPEVPIMRGDLYRSSGKGGGCQACNGAKVIKVTENCDKCGGWGCPHCGNSGVVIVSSKCPDCGGK